MPHGVPSDPRSLTRQQNAVPLSRNRPPPGGRWETRDTDDPAGDGNALDRLLEDFTFKASVIIAVLPNGLPVTYLSNEKGGCQDAAPVNIVGNHKSPDNDLEIGVGTWTCFNCHGGALAKIRDYGRVANAEETGLRLSVVDPAKERRARYAYLTDDFAFEFESDQKRSERKYEDASGLEAPELVKAVAAQWRAYRVDAVTLKRAGVTPGALRAGLRALLRQAGRARPPGTRSWRTSCSTTRTRSRCPSSCSRSGSRCSC
ncbi:MAG TPA: hypothetical protein VGE74_28650 [Gemmata sp.]